MPKLPRAWGYYANSVAIVTVQVGDTRNAMPAEWTTPLSIQPPMLGAMIGVRRYTYTFLEKANSMGINLLADDQAGLSAQCGNSSGRDTDKFAAFDIPVLDAETVEAPLIAGCLASYEVALTQLERFGDHVLAAGVITAVHVNEEKRPLLYQGGTYYQLGERMAKPE